MKYIKLYESEKRRLIYWLLPNDDRLYDALEKIPSKTSKAYINYFKNGEIDTKEKYVFVSIDDDWSWGWMPFEGELHNNWYDKKGYEFMGVVNMEEYEIYIDKYNL